MAVLRTVRAYLRRSVSLPPFCCFFAFAGRKRGTLLSPSLVFLSASPSPPLAHRTGVSFPARQQELGERFAGWLSVFSQLALAIEKLETFLPAARVLSTEVFTALARFLRGLENLERRRDSGSGMKRKYT